VKEQLCAVAPAQSLFTFEDDTPGTSHVGNNETLFYQLDGVLRDRSFVTVDEALSAPKNRCALGG